MKIPKLSGRAKAWAKEICGRYVGMWEEYPGILAIEVHDPPHRIARRFDERIIKFDGRVLKLSKSDVVELNFWEMVKELERAK